MSWLGATGWLGCPGQVRQRDDVSQPQSPSAPASCPQLSSLPLAQVPRHRKLLGEAQGAAAGYLDQPCEPRKEAHRLCALVSPSEKQSGKGSRLAGSGLLGREDLRPGPAPGKSYGRPLCQHRLSAAGRRLASDYMVFPLNPLPGAPK